MSSEYSTLKGLVLREVAWKESDKLLTVLTDARGKRLMTARGAKSPKSRKRAACQALTYAEFTVSERRDRMEISEARVLEPFLALRGDVELLALGSYFCQVLETVSQEDLESPELLRLGLNSLYALGAGRDRDIVKAAFELRLCAEAGFGPEPDWVAEMPVGTGFPPIETAGCAAAVEHIAGCEAKKLFSFDITGDARRELCALAESWVCSRLETGFSTLDFYKSIKI
ncbi:MAG: DNA repair protein RecO [Oscillospiraceae bacterium]|nr:DNA repair protein RecO [Oscillospiraceae bacterium]